MGRVRLYVLLATGSVNLAKHLCRNLYRHL